MIKIKVHVLIVMDMEVRKDYGEARRWRIDSKIFQHTDVVYRVKEEWLEI